MNYAKEIARMIVPMMVGFITLYLIGAFVSASWNIADWTAEARLVCAIWGSVFSAGVWMKLERMSPL